MTPTDGTESPDRYVITEEEQDWITERHANIHFLYEYDYCAYIKADIAGVTVPVIISTTEEPDGATNLYPIAILVTDELFQHITNPAGEPDLEVVEAAETKEMDGSTPD